MDTVFYNLAITSAPIEHLNLRLAHTLDDRSNLTSRNKYHTTNLLDLGTGLLHYNLPFSYERNAIVAETSYQVLPGRKLLLHYNLGLTLRNFVNTVNTTGNAVQAKVRSQLTDTLFGSLSYWFATRNAQNYDPFGGPNQENVTATSATSQYDYLGFERYYRASRTRNEVKGTLDYTPFEGPLAGVSASLIAKVTSDFYPNDASGMRNNNNFTIGPDIDWKVHMGLNFHVYYIFLYICFNQNSMYWPAGVTPPCQITAPPPVAGAPAAGCAGAWNNKSTDIVNTFGVSADWSPRDDLKFGLEYNLSTGNVGYTLVDGGALAFGLGTTAGQQPALAFAGNWNTNSLNSVLMLKAEWKIRDNASLLGAISWDRMYLSDASQVVGPTQ